MTRDLTKKQFNAAIAKYGFKPQGFMGYYELTLDNNSRVSVSAWNAGERRRDRLAYLLQQLGELNARIGNGK